MLNRGIIGIVILGLLVAKTANAGEPLEKIRETVEDVLAVLSDESLQSSDNKELRSRQATSGRVSAIRF